MSRRNALTVVPCSMVLAASLWGCAPAGGGDATGGRAPASGGAASGGSGSGGATATGGAVGPSSGGTSGGSGGATSSGGAQGTGGASTGGAAMGGGNATGGSGSGGRASTGSGGGSAAGGAASGGRGGGSGGQGMGGAASGGTSGGGGSGPCQRGQVKANEVLWVGDSWIQIPGTQHNTVRDLARQAGSLGASEDYVDKAVSGSPIATIVNQYTSYQAGATKVKVLLMDGGGIDVMQGGKSASSVTNVVEAFKKHLAKVATDGTVQHIVYYLYPQLPASGPGMDVGPLLRSGMQAACEASTVPCHFLYLETLFAGHSEYIGSDSLHPSDAGGRVIGNAVWSIMKEHCIAQ